jgi:glutamate dehydrogenase (NAD(P)+)
MTTSAAVYTVQVPETGLEAWLVVDSTQGGLAFGGTRISTSVTLAEVAELARCMSWKLHAHGRPVGGAKAGIRCDPADPALPLHLEHVARQLEGPLRESVVLGKDMGATDASLDLLYAALGCTQLHLVQKTTPQCPDRLRELEGYQSHMTGLGVSWAARAAMGGLEGARVVIQGGGVVGRGSAHRLAALGATVHGICDRDGGWFSEEGFPPEFWAALGSASRELPQEKMREIAQPIPRDEVLGLDADLLVLAAGSHGVDGRLSECVQTPWVVEGANFGLTAPAREALFRRGVRVVPDLLASSSSAAMVAHQLRSGNGLEASELWRGIEEAITLGVEACLSRSRREGVPPREAWIAQIREG